MQLTCFCFAKIFMKVIYFFKHLQTDCHFCPCLSSVICPPTSVTGVTACSNNDITVTWDPSPQSGVNYFVQSREDGGISANYSTTQTSHQLTGLQCGELYTLTVAASDDECSSAFSEPIQANTG